MACTCATFCFEKKTTGGAYHLEITCRTEKAKDAEKGEEREESQIPTALSTIYDAFLRERHPATNPELAVLSMEQG